MKSFCDFDSFVLGFLSLGGFTSKINDCLLAIDFDFRLRRITNKTNTIPIITGTQAPIVPPTIAGKFSDKDNRTVVVSSTHWYPSSQP